MCRIFNLEYSYALSFVRAGRDRENIFASQTGSGCQDPPPQLLPGTMQRGRRGAMRTQPSGLVVPTGGESTPTVSALEPLSHWLVHTVHSLSLLSPLTLV